MVRWIARCAVAAATLSGTAILFGQQSGPPTSLIAGSPWLRVDVVMGRVTVVRAQIGQKTSVVESRSQNSREETLSVNLADMQPVVHYRLVDSDGTLAVDFLGRTELAVDFTPAGGNARPSVRFHQPNAGPSELIVGPSDAPTHYPIESLWRFMLTEPRAAQRHLLPLLAVLRVDDNLERQAEVVERTLLSETSGGDAGSLSRWQTAVDRLGSPRFDERRRADMQLRRDGHRALTYLKSLDRSQLTAEQRLRIRRIVDDLQDHRPDTPRRVAAWLVSDRDVWLALSQRGDEEQRALAASYLRRLRNEGDASTPTIRIASQSQPQGR